MHRKFLFLLTVIFLVKGRLSAGPVTVTDARTVALNFFNLTTDNNQQRLPLTATLQYTRTEADSTVDLYVFNISPLKGFVIVSATDNDQPIVGYSTESLFNNDFGNTGVNDWLNRWSEELHYVILNNIVATPGAAVEWAAYRQGISPGNAKSGPVAPLCSTTWNQEDPYGPPPVLYNNDCPAINGTNCVTGCVATAMAQIMKYWKYPTTGTGSSSYDDSQYYGYQENIGTLSFNYGSTTFSWPNMPNSLSSSSTTTQIDAVATLMYACGVSVAMDYDTSGSGSVMLTVEAGGGACAQNAYVQYFGYDSNTINGVLLSTTTSTALTNSIEADLNAGRVVQLQGKDATQGGHSWVCDGYDANNNLHMNWGWSGQSDGYYALTNLAPTDGGYDFTEDIGALLGIQPPPNPIGEQATISNSTICSGSTDTLKATTHTGATYSWSPTMGLSCSTCATTAVTATVTTVYTVTADSAGSTATASVSVNVDAPIVPGAGSTTSVSCHGGSNGSATMTATGGTGGYTYLWSNNGTSSTISNLTAAIYEVTITDTKGCTATASKTVSQPNVLTGTVTTTNASCGSPGSALVTASGGTSAYAYHWTGGQTSASISNLSAGNYSVTITDAHSCTATATGTVASTGSLSITLTPTEVKCFGVSTGSITASVTGGTGLTYSWSTGGNSATISNLAAGPYSLTVSSSSGCSATTSETITQPASAVSASLTPVNASCNLSNGSVSVTATGGSAGYTYDWNTGASTAAISGLGAGSYEVTVKDANGCSISASTTLSNVAGLNASATATPVSCYGGSNGSITVTVTGSTGNLTYDWSNNTHNAVLSNVPAGSYSVTVSETSGCSASLTESVSQAAALDISLTPAGAACGSPNGSVTANVSGGTAGYSYTWSNGNHTSSIANLAAGTYNLTVTDQNNCSASASSTVSNSGSLSLNPTVVDITCNGDNNGSASVTPANGTSPYTYSWSNGDKTSSISNLPAGLFDVTVTDDHGCSSTASVNITQPEALALTISSTDCSSGQNNGSATADATGGTGYYTYSWSDGYKTQIISNLVAGTYQVSVTDQNGCEATATVIVNTTTGLSQVNTLNFSLYPNPASSSVVVSLPVLDAEAMLSLRNILGQQLFLQPITSTQTHIDVSNLAGGIYIVEIRQADKVAVRQLVVNK